MSKLTHIKAQSLIKNLLLPFYLIERDMLIPDNNGVFSRNENDAEHSWSTAVLACSLAEHIDKTLNIGLVSQFALVHDLLERYASDVSVWANQSELDDKPAAEAMALEKITKQFSKFPWLINTLAAYERQDTNEALYVRAIDKYIALSIRFMDRGKFYKQQGITKQIFEEKLVVHRQKAYLHPGVAKYYELVRKEYDNHPEHFA